MLVGSAFRGQMGKPLPCAWVLKSSLTLAYSHAYMSSGFHGQNHLRVCHIQDCPLWGMLSSGYTQNKNYYISYVSIKKKKWSCWLNWVMWLGTLCFLGGWGTSLPQGLQSQPQTCEGEARENGQLFPPDCWLWLLAPLQDLWLLESTPSWWTL